MKTPWLSLITITKDDSEGLAHTLASTTALREAGVEQLVVDGSEAAATAGDDLASSSPENGVRVLARPARGIADALNAGLAEATGEWVWFLNGGDCVDPRLKPTFLSNLLAASGARVVIGGTTYAGEAAPRMAPPGHLRWPPFRSWIPHPSTLVRREMFERHGGFNERYKIAMDYEWWLRAIPTGIDVDVISVPFAVFALGGVSQRPESLPVLKREKRHALRRHQAGLVKTWWSASIRLWRAWSLGWLGRRLPRSERGRDE